MNSEYARKVEILLRMIPLVTEEGVFAVHGGTAINLFVRNLPRYSVDIDLTYIPLEDRASSLAHINGHLHTIAQKARKSFPGVHIVEKPEISKLLCEYRGRQIKIEVNQTKRGVVGGEVVRKAVCEKAQDEFGLYCETDIVSMTQLYGGKIAAALSRQHPRDLFDVKYMEYTFEQTREGLLFCLLGSDRPIHESFAPSLIDQHDALVNQFDGMSDIPFTYEEFEQTREELIRKLNALVTPQDKSFLLSFESSEPDWEHFEFGYFQDYPSVKWKLQNLLKLKSQNPTKLKEEVSKLERIFKGL
jgi:predicted nucleotidyltransferase component of viral defense system